MHGFAFVPRPFPPPALADVPLEYIIDQLRRLAPHYWSKPETSDCTIVVPLDTKASISALGPSNDTAADACLPFSDPDDLEQEIHEPSSRPAPRMVMQLHMDYLCAHSALLRGLFSGASPFDLIESPSSPSLSSRPSTPPSPELEERRARRTSLRIPPVPCLLPSPPTHPSIYLPVPDPASFRLLVHYIYFGSTAFIEDALDEGTIAWEGLARNVEYLGMGAEIKIVLGNWYRRWRCGPPSGYDSGSDSDSDSDSDDFRYDGEYDGAFDQELELPPKDASVELSPTVFDPDEAYYKAGDDDDCGKALDSEPPRGRRRATRRLGHSFSDPGLHSTRQQKEKVRAPRGRSK
ncbi:hypothetical protein POSPLADRAFT_1054291 [Postia placenta MAD-698-R-SB12]|uniref:BTB domain-containing protein n=1 Tax=Postia placenta MAD-698-R-SB12 TaxID=670580 RepID=A0A1X6NAG0_9APHY|nr:hypothetical protein POSPLADRAFT_1054291 [Postia placenta MAD-698-R-SB12]OSX65554.1 hypothetical protein POSPLADRAFT_1054291 [Postia placenta MAD-698-R-SB12]